MQIKKHWLVVIILIITILPLVACGGTESDGGHPEPYEKEEIAGTEFNLITLTEKAAERLDIQSAAVVEEDVDGEMKLVIPYAAVIYGNNGETWAYVRNPHSESLSFHRAEIDVDHIDGGKAVLSAGPELGTHVVTVGVAELYGTDTGVGK